MASKVEHRYFVEFRNLQSGEKYRPEETLDIRLAKRLALQLCGKGAKFFPIDGGIGKYVGNGNGCVAKILRA